MMTSLSKKNNKRNGIWRKYPSRIIESIFWRIILILYTSVLLFFIEGLKMEVLVDWAIRIVGFVLTVLIPLVRSYKALMDTVHTKRWGLYWGVFTWLLFI